MIVIVDASKFTAFIIVIDLVIFVVFDASTILFIELRFNLCIARFLITLLNSFIKIELSLILTFKKIKMVFLAIPFSTKVVNLIRPHLINLYFILNFYYSFFSTTITHLL